MLTVSRLTKSFGGRVLFEDASLQVNRGERIALIGPNGAGKTTLLSILLEMDEADAGEVLADPTGEMVKAGSTRIRGSPIVGSPSRCSSVQARRELHR